LLYRMCPFSTGGRDAACPLSTRGGWGGVQDHVRLPVIVENLEKEQKRARHWKRNKKGAALERRNCFRTTRPGCPEARARARACGAARLAPPRAAAAAKKGARAEARAGPPRGFTCASLPGSGSSSRFCARSWLTESCARSWLTESCARSWLTESHRQRAAGRGESRAGSAGTAGARRGRRDGRGCRHRMQTQDADTGRHRVQTQGADTGCRHRVQTQGADTGDRQRFLAASANVVREHRGAP